MDRDVTNGHECDVLYASANTHHGGKASVEGGEHAEEWLAREVIDKVGFIGAQDHVGAEAELAGGEDDF